MMPVLATLRPLLPAAAISCLFVCYGTQAQTVDPLTAAILDMQGTRLASHQAATPQNAVQEIKLKQQLILQKNGQFRSVSDSLWPGNIRFQFLSTGNKDGMAVLDLLQWRQGLEITRGDASEARKAYADFLFLVPAFLQQQASNLQPVPLPGDTSGKYEQVNFSDAAGRPASQHGHRT
ncbi:hypothetical protein ACO0LC_19915 [Undibacterium sp. JH2W]|uniref:hypothetical protein n=1 Tax=Undibacterium sp. JH2W TaxID=3413037 RepID=UPI003BF1F7A2